MKVRVVFGIAVVALFATLLQFGSAESEVSQPSSEKPAESKTPKALTSAGGNTIPAGTQHGLAPTASADQSAEKEPIVAASKSAEEKAKEKEKKEKAKAKAKAKKEKEKAKKAKAKAKAKAKKEKEKAKKEKAKAKAKAKKEKEAKEKKAKEKKAKS